MITLGEACQFLRRAGARVRLTGAGPAPQIEAKTATAEWRYVASIALISASAVHCWVEQNIVHKAAPH